MHIGDAHGATDAYVELIVQMFRLFTAFNVFIEKKNYIQNLNKNYKNYFLLMQNKVTFREIHNCYT